MADTDIQGMLVRIEATTQQLRGELSRADRAVAGASSKIDGNLGVVDRAFDRMGISAQQAGKIVGTAVAGLVTGAAAAGAASLAMLRQTAEATAETQRWAKSLGMNTRSLQEWQYAAERAGLSGDNMADIFKDIGDKIGDVLITNGGEAVDALNKLGLSAKALATLSPDQQLLAIAKGLESVGTQAEKINILESLGNDLSRMLPLLDNNAEGFRKLAKQAGDYGIAMDQKQIDALTKTYDLLKDMEDQARGLKNEFAAGLASVDISPLQDSMDSLHAIVTDPEFQQGMTDLAAMVLKITGAAAQGIARLPADVQSLINQYQVLKASAFGTDKDRHLAGVTKQQELVDNLAAYNNASGPMGKFATDPSLYVGDALLNKDWKAAQRDAEAKLDQYKRYTKQMGWDDGKSDAPEAPATTLPTTSITGLLGKNGPDKAAEAAQKTLDNAFKTTEEGYKRQIALINTTGDKQKDATEVMKLSFELQEGKLGNLSEARKKELMGMATELDRLKEIQKANEDALKLSAFKSAQDVGTQTIKDGFNQELSGIGMGDKARDRMRADLALQQKYATDVANLNEQLQAKNISDEMYASQTAVLKAALDERIGYQHQYYAMLDEAQANWMNGVNEAWANYAAAARDYSTRAADITNTALQEGTSGLGTFFSDVASGAQDADDALGDMVGNFAKSMLNALSDMAAQWLIYQGVQLLVGKTTQASAAGTLGANAQAMSLTAGLNAYAATAGIPIIGPAAAPAAMATAMAVTGPLASAVGMTALAGMAHDGIDSVPKDGTWFLQEGERVTTAQTSAKLDAMLSRIDNGLNNAQPYAQIGAGSLEANSNGRPAMIGAGEGTGGAAPVQPIFNMQVTVQAQPGASEADTKRTSESATAAMEQMVVRVIDRETRQGGVLWRR
nr:phage tail tape measure C-terminal domain-containing protein [Pseudomonas carnis]